MRAQGARWVWVGEKAGLWCLLPGGLMWPLFEPLKRKVHLGPSRCPGAPSPSGRPM